MVLHNPNNWHWVNKDIAPWTQDYLEKSLVGLSADDGPTSVAITKILSMDGDVDVSQRKGKVITLFDVKLKLEYRGKTTDAEDVSGTILVPEVSHDTEEDEFVFEIDIYNESVEKQPVKDLVRTKVVPQLRQRLAQLAPAIIKEHAKDLQHAAGINPSDSFTPAKVYTSSNVTKEAKPAPGEVKTSQASNGSKVNVTTVTDTDEFRTSADQLYATFTDPQRIAAFTREPPRVFEGAKVGAKFELFGGNVAGSYAELQQPSKIVQKWRLRDWPAGHFSELSIVFDQNDVDGVTNMRVSWSGVPVGQEEVTLRNWREYYVRSIKMTFGFGTVL